jgi:hypothetical protein
METSVRQAISTKKNRPSHLAHTSFSGNENHLIDTERAIELTERYRLSVALDSHLGGFFGRQAIAKLLSQNACVGIRIYFAEEDDGKPSFVLVGADANNRDLFQGHLLGCPLMDSSSLSNRLFSTDTPSFEGNALLCGRKDHSITLPHASRLTRNFRGSPRFIDAKAGFFAKNIFNKILSEPDCIGIFVYHALRDDGKQTLVIAGTDQAGRHYAKWPFGDDTFICPPWCPSLNTLNH